MTTDNSTGLQRLKRWAANLRAENNSLGHSLETYAMEWEEDLARAAVAALSTHPPPSASAPAQPVAPTQDVAHGYTDGHWGRWHRDPETGEPLRGPDQAVPAEVFGVVCSDGDGVLARQVFSAPPVVQPPRVWHFEGVPPAGSTCLVWARSSFAKGPFYTVDNYGEQHEAPVSWSSATIPVGEGWDTFDHDDVIAWSLLEQSGPAAPASDADSMPAQPTKEPT